MTIQRTVLALTLAASFAVVPPVSAQVCSPAFPCGDINGSDDVTVADALAVLRRSIGLSVDMICLCDGGGECPAGGVIQSVQSLCWDPLDLQAPISEIDCAGTGQDGELQAGLEPMFVDNLDGTITDLRSTLTWEKLSNDNSIHDYDDTSFLWYGAFQKVDALNAMAFAGHSDWRVPQVRELATLVDYTKYNPATFGIFNNACAPGCTIEECSCTYSGDYWSSTTYQQTPQLAWDLDIRAGQLESSGSKVQYRYVRAVRGGY